MLRGLKLGMQGLERAAREDWEGGWEDAELLPTDMGGVELA